MIHLLERRLKLDNDTLFCPSPEVEESEKAALYRGRFRYLPGEGKDCQSFRI
jgi:hypothetical protein